MKRPAFLFYPGDWQRNAKLRMCSLAARGLWLEMICIMHQSDVYGHLRIGPTSVTTEILGRVVGISIEDILPLVLELEHAGVFSRDADGTIICRRMISDEKLRLSRAAGGVKSLENPRVPRPKDNLRDVHGGSSKGSNGVPSPSSSSSVSVSNNDDVGSTPRDRRADRLWSFGFTRKQIEFALDHDEKLVDAWIAWLESPHPKAGSPVAIAFAGIRDDQAPQSSNGAIRNGYTAAQRAAARAKGEEWVNHAS
jgi:hypothetical protein